MPSWNELHYERAAEFSRLIATLYSRGVSPAAASVPSVGRPATPPLAALVRQAGPVDPTAAQSSPAAPVAAPRLAPAPTAASIFNKIPWKK